MAEMLADGLADRGYDAVPLGVESGGGESSSAKNRFDALVTDLRMPEVDGLELLASSRGRIPSVR